MRARSASSRSISASPPQFRRGRVTLAVAAAIAAMHGMVVPPEVFLVGFARAASIANVPPLGEVPERTEPRMTASKPAELRVAAAEDAASQAIEQWVRDLDDGTYQVRRRAQMELIRLGPQVLPKVVPACRDRSAEVRARARRIVAVVRHDQLAAGFRAIGETRDDADIDLESGMILVSQLIDPDTDPAWVRRQLDGWAEQVRQKLGSANPRTAEPAVVVGAICDTLFGPGGFAGNAGDFDDPRNSALSHVLKRRTGLPILLSQVAIAVGNRLGVPLEGVALPYRYMFKYDGSRAPMGVARVDIIVDAYGGGRIVNEDDLEDIISRLGGGFDPLRHLQTCPRRETLARMLRNLERDFAARGRHVEAFQARTFLQLLQGKHQTR